MVSVRVGTKKMADVHASLQIDMAKLYALVAPALGGGGGNGGQPDPDRSLKPGPWDPVIRLALKEVLRFGPQPEPWRYGPQPEPWIAAVLSAELLSLIAHRFPSVWDVIGGTLRPGEAVYLNPQPLPPQDAFVVALGDALVVRVEMLAEVAAALQHAQSSGEERGIIIVGGYVDRLIDEFCGNGFRLVWPFPGPRPRWFKAEVGAHDLLLLGAHLNAAAERAFDLAVRGALSNASAKLGQVGIERLG